MPVVNTTLYAAFGPGRAGLADAVGLVVSDAAGTARLVISGTDFIAEVLDTAGGGTGTYRSTVALDTAWLPARAEWNITGQAGAVAAETVGLDFALADAAPVKANVTEVLGFAAKIYDGVARAGGANTITLQADAAAIDDIFKYRRIALVGGRGAGQARTVVSYSGATLVATVDRPWAVVPDATSQYQFLDAADVDLDALDCGGVNGRQALALAAAGAGAGKLLGLPTPGSAGTGRLRDAADTRDLAAVTFDAVGNRTVITLDLP